MLSLTHKDTILYSNIGLGTVCCNNEFSCSVYHSLFCSVDSTQQNILKKRSISYFTQTPCHPSSKNTANNIFLIRGTGCFSFFNPPIFAKNFFLNSAFFNILKHSIVIKQYFSFGNIKNRLFQSNQNFKPTILKFLYRDTFFMEKYLLKLNAFVRILLFVKLRQLKVHYIN